MDEVVNDEKLRKFNFNILVKETYFCQQETHLMEPDKSLLIKK